MADFHQPRCVPPPPVIPGRIEKIRLTEFATPVRNIPGSNGFCGFRYDPQMNADRRSQPVQPVRVRVHPRFAGITAV